MDVCYGKDYKHLNEGNFPVLGTGGVMGYVDEYLYSGESILIGRKGTIDKPKYINGPFWTVDTLFYTKIKEGNPKFIFYQLNKINWLKYNEASGVPSLSANNIKNIKIKIPSLEEQKKIASFLSAVDKKIELLEKKLVLYQKIVNFNIFKIYSDINDYNEIKLKDIVRPYTSNLSINKLEENQGNYPLYGAEGIIKHVDFYELENPYISIIKDGAGVGRLDLCKEFSSALGTLQCLIPNKDIDINFLYFYLKTLKFRKYIVGSTIPHIYFKDYSNERIKVPSLKDQQNIGNYFALLEKRNDILQKKIKIFNTFKQGLLRKMFV